VFEGPLEGLKHLEAFSRFSLHEAVTRGKTRKKLQHRAMLQNGPERWF
jgi:hypothetical protein